MYLGLVLLQFGRQKMEREFLVCFGASMLNYTPMLAKLALWKKIFQNNLFMTPNWVGINLSSVVYASEQKWVKWGALFPPFPIDQPLCTKVHSLKPGGSQK